MADKPAPRYHRPKAELARDAQEGRCAKGHRVRWEPCPRCHPDGPVLTFRPRRT